MSTVIWSRLLLVTIDLQPGDNAQMIFETLNARGTPLLAGDLIKNHLFQTATSQGDNRDELYEQHWKVLDSDWWRQDVQRGRLLQPRLDIYLSHWLAMSSGRDIVSHQLFPEFKRYLADGNKLAKDVLADLARYGAVYEVFEKEPATTELGRFLYRLNAMESTTAYPALLWMLGPEGIADPADRRAALDAIESWLVRRMLTRQTTQAYNQVFLALLNRVREAATSRSGPPVSLDVIEYLGGLTGQRAYWPTAGQVRSTLRTLPAYLVFSRSRLRMVLEALEQAMYTGFEERVQIEHDLTIEHVLPQKWSEHWPLPDGVDPLQGRLDRDAALHRLGNLTLLTQKLNTVESNWPWVRKRPKLQKHSLLLLSKDLKDSETWDEAAIAERGERLISLALSVWARPNDSETEISSDQSVRPVEAVSVRQAGPKDPDDPDGFTSVLGIADEVGVGTELRRIIAVSRELGLCPRPYWYSVGIAPPADRKKEFVNFKPQPDDGGSFEVWRSTDRLARSSPGVTMEAVRAAVGVSDEKGTLLAQDTEAYLTVLRDLISSRADESVEVRIDALRALDIPGVERLPGNILRLIDHRAGDSPEIALRFAAGALGVEGVVLRPQDSKGEPGYFQVRHPRFGQVVVYSTPHPGEIGLQFRLSETQDTYGLATAVSGQYGIVLTVKDENGLATALRLLEDALAAPS